MTVGPAIAVILALLQSGGNYGRPLDTPANRAAGMLRFSGGCAVRDVPASARKVLATQVASDQEARAVRALTGVARKCYPIQMPAFPPTAVRGSVAEALYRSTLGRTKPHMVSAPPPTSFTVVPAGQSGTPAQETAWSLAAVGRCAVYADAPAAHEWVMGPANVPEEERRFGLLKPALARCVPAAQLDQITPGLLRGFVAEALLDRGKDAQ